MGLPNNDGDMSQDVQNAYEEIEQKKVLSSLKIWLRRLDKLTASGVADYVDVTAYSKYVMQLNVNGGILFNSGKSDVIRGTQSS